MNKLKSFSFFLILGVTGITACTKNTLNLPEPARTIEGIYEAQNNLTSFPIKGQTIRLTIGRLTADSASVIVKAVANGQAGDSLGYRSAFVAQEFDQFNGCVAYRVYLTAQKVLDPQNPNEFEQLTMTCDEKNVFKYYYKPAGQQAYTVVKFKKL